MSKAAVNKYKLYRVRGKKKTQIYHAGAVSWSDSLETLGVELSFKMARNVNDRFIDREPKLALGDKVILHNTGRNIFVFEGMVVNIGTTKNEYSIKCLDYAHLLNKNKDFFQFKGVSSTAAIKTVLKRFKVPFGHIENIPTKVKKVYSNESLADIIKDILDNAKKKTGKLYRLECQNGKIVVKHTAKMPYYPLFKPADNVPWFDPFKHPADVSSEYSIEDLKNVVKVVSGENKNMKIEVTVKDNKSIKKYGTFTELISVSKDDRPQARSQANQELKNNSRPTEKITLKCLGDDNAKSGRIVKINHKKTMGISGEFLIESSSHSFDGNNRIMEITLKRRKWA